MTTTYPDSIQGLTATRGTPGIKLGDPQKNHITHHTIEDDTSIQLQTKLGIGSSNQLAELDRFLVGIGSGETERKTLADVIELVGGIGNGTAVGQMLYWNGSIWQYIDISKLFWDNASGRLGIGTSTPRVITDILDSTNPQLRLTYTDNSVYTDLQTNSAGDLSVNSALIIKDKAVGAGQYPKIVGSDNLSNLSLLQLYPSGGTNVNMSMQIIPKGTGNVNNRAQFNVFNTDYFADTSNYEFFACRARGTDYVLFAGKFGTAETRPIIFSADALVTNQFYLGTNGNVGVNTTTPKSKFEVNGSIGKKVINVNSATATLDVTNEFVGVSYTSSGAVTITLPSATSAYNVDGIGRIYTISDTGSNAGLNNITVNRAGADTIIGSEVGQTSYKLTADGETIRIIAINSTTWKILF